MAGDDLGTTATAPGSGEVGPKPAFKAGDTLGRYRLERELGAGGMGVVYAAYDADLERSIALKVLRSSADGEARQRLLREARAMARLAHPNVVSVHEVGSANGQDFVAMELVEGETLGEWLSCAGVAVEDKMEALVAAGRGLAAAHAAGLVHRDFKPHNVLRAKDGRILVTDFGLARGVEQTTSKISAASVKTTGSLGSVTLTGSVLGTPAYMAPEQWKGGTIGPASDQFAFCVAVWEALAGARPFKGATVDELRREVERGPDAVDASKLPRWLRAVLRRGLDPDPKRRWPNMNALLARLDPRARRWNRWAVIALGAAAGALIAVSIAMAVGRGTAAAESSCTTKMDPEVVWPATAKAAIEKAGQGPAAEMLDADVQKWLAVKGQTCQGDPAVKVARLGCLDAVLARLDAVARGVETVTNAPLHVDAGELLVDPSVCLNEPAPRLRLTSSAEVRDAIGIQLRQEATPGPPMREAIASLVRRTANDACAAAVAHQLASGASEDAKDRKRHLEQAQEAAATCGDDRVIADVAIAAAASSMGNEWLGDEIINRVKLAESAVRSVAQPDLAAQLDELKMYVAQRAENLDTAIQRGQDATAGFASRQRTQAQVAAAMYVAGLQKARGRAEDVAAFRASIVGLRRLAVEKLGGDDEIVRILDQTVANDRMATGDVAGAHEALAKLRRVRPNDHARHVAGRVVDAGGAPVAGVTVTVGSSLAGDLLAAATPGDYDRVATTGEDGRFSIADAPKDGVAVAQRGDLRAWAVPLAEEMVLTLEPTSRVEGRIELHGAPAENVTVVAVDPATAPTAPYAVVAPVGPDGSFVLAGVPRRVMHVSATTSQSDYTGKRELSSTTVEVKGEVASGVALALQSSKRVVHVIVRSTVGVPLVNAQAFVATGSMPPTVTAKELIKQLQSHSTSLAQPIASEHAPQAVLEQSRAGDMYVTINTAPEGEASACALALPAELADEDLWRKVRANYDKLEIHCKPIGRTDSAVVVEVPPWPRFD